MSGFRRIQPVLGVASGTQFRPRGWIGERVAANEEHWLLPAPVSNPGIVEMFARPVNLKAGNGPFGGLVNDWRNPDPVPWAGEFVGKWLISATQSIGLTAGTALQELTNRVTSDVISTQDPHDGSLGLELSWDVWNQYHVMLGLLRRFQQTGAPALLATVRKAAEGMLARYGGRASALSSDNPGDDEKNQTIIHLLLLLYQETGAAEYLSFADQIRAEWSSNRCLNRNDDGTVAAVSCGNFIDNALAGGDFFHGTRRRWEALHDVQAIAEFYFITGEPKYRTAFEQIWHNLRCLERHLDGGLGGNEGTTGDRDTAQYVETCATVAWMALSVDMLRISDEPAAADELEQSLFNAILGAQSPDGRLWTYHTPVAGAPLTTLPVNEIPPAPWAPEVFLGYRLPAAFDLDWQSRDRYPQFSCCAANGPRGLGCLSEWAVMRGADNVTVNFYGPSTTTVQLPDGSWITIEQDTEYPLGGHIGIRVGLRVPSAFVLRLRVPSWSAATSVRVNGESIPCEPGTYCAIQRLWLPDDIVDVDLDLSVRFVDGSGRTAGLVAAYRGPLLLTCDGRFGTDPLDPPRIRRQQPMSVSLAESGTRVKAVFRTSGPPMTLTDYASAWAFGGGRLTGRPNPSGSWQLSRSGWQVDRTRGEDLLASRMVLRPDGSVEGNSHPNEARWGFEGDDLTFYAANGVPTTRFTIREARNGRQWLSGFSLLDPSVRHVLSEVDDGVAGKTWQFARRVRGAADAVILPALGTMPGGAFDQPTHPNEAQWARDRGDLVFAEADGTITSRFGPPQMVNGRVEYSGSFTGDANITHVLTEIDPDPTVKVWRLWRHQKGHNDEVIDDKIRLLPDGRLDGHLHPNEATWRLDGTDILLISAAGATTTRLAPVAARNGVMNYEGQFSKNPAITHRLEERAIGWPLGPGYVTWLEPADRPGVRQRPKDPPVIGGHVKGNERVKRPPFFG